MTPINGLKKPKLIFGRDSEGKYLSVNDFQYSRSIDMAKTNEDERQLPLSRPLAWASPILISSVPGSRRFQSALYSHNHRQCWSPSGHLREDEKTERPGEQEDSGGRDEGRTPPNES